MASSSGRVRRNSSEKMSSSRSRQAAPRRPSRRRRPAPTPSASLDHPLGLDAQQLLLVVPLVERLGLVEALVALQADQAAAGDAGHRLGQLGLARAGRALDQHRLGQPVGQVDDPGDAVVGQVADLGQPGPHVGHRREARRSRVRGSRATPGRARGSSACLVGRRSPPHLPVAVDDVLHARQLAQPHRAAGVQLLGGDADLGPEAELAAVDEAGRGVDEHGGGVDLATEALGGAQVAGDDGLGVPRPEAGDVVDGGVEVRRPPPPPASGPGTRWRSRSSVAGAMSGTMAAGALVADAARPRRGRRAARGRKPSATASWTRSDSAALHTPGRCVLAFTTIDSAMSRSAAAST